MRSVFALINLLGNVMFLPIQYMTPFYELILAGDFFNCVFAMMDRTFITIRP